MELHPTLLLRLLLASFFFGAVAGVLYDTVRLQRVLLGICRYSSAEAAPVFRPKFCRARRKKPKSERRRKAEALLLAVQDIVFCICVGAMVAVLLFYRNEGEFRGFVLVGVVLGFTAYYFTVGKLIVWGSEYVIFALRTALLYAVYYLTLPFVALARLLFSRLAALFRRIRADRQERRIRRYHEAVCQQLVESSAHGFLEGAWEEKAKTA